MKRRSNWNLIYSDKKYKKSPKRDYREKSRERERYSNGRRRDYEREGKDRYSDKEYYSGGYYEKDKYSKHSRNGSRGHHKSRRDR